MIGARNARPAPVTRRHPDDAGDRRGGKAAWHSRARPQHRRQGRAREPQRAAVDLTRAFSTRGHHQQPILRAYACSRETGYLASGESVVKLQT